MTTRASIALPRRSIINQYGLLIVFWLSLSMAFSCSSHKERRKRSERIVIDAEFARNFFPSLRGIFHTREVMGVQYTPYKYISSDPPSNFVNEELLNGRVTWELYSTEYVKVTPPYGLPVIMKPGDSLHIQYVNDRAVYSGTNNGVLDLLNRIMHIEQGLAKPQQKSSFKASKFADFEEWNRFADLKLSLVVPVLDSFKNIISSMDYEYYKANVVNSIESDRLESFFSLMETVQEGEVSSSVLNLCDIWDSTQNKIWRKWLESLAEYNGTIDDFYEYNQGKVWREYGFNFANDTLKSKAISIYLQYENAKRDYVGQLRERLLAFILDEQSITELGPTNSTVKVMLTDYYAQSGFPEYKRWVKGLETTAKKKYSNNDARKL